MNNKSPIVLPIGILLLAAGASHRMGRPKQLLKIGEETLIERAIKLTQAINHQQTIIVLGANAEKIKPSITPMEKLAVIINENWQRGMGTTVKAGIGFFLAQKQKYSAIIIMVCDQPYLTTEKLEELIAKHQQSKAAIVATTYGGIKGVPVLFDKSIFPRLLQLNKDEGARKIIKNYKGKIATVAFPEGIIDLDTPAAYQAFLEKQKSD